MSRQGPDAVSGRGERETPGTADAEASCRDRGRRVDLSVRAGGLSPEGEGRVSQRTTWVCAVRSCVFSSKKENTVDSAHLIHTWTCSPGIGDDSFHLYIPEHALSHSKDVLH